MGRVLFLGATSTIGRAIAAEFARDGTSLFLVARNAEELAAVAADLRVRYGVEVREAAIDALSPDLEAMIGNCLAGTEGAVLCWGYLGDPKAARSDMAEVRRILDVNLTSAVIACEVVARHLEERGGGFLAVISSVAGDRGRKANYLYGAAKAGLTAYLSGLRQRLHGAGVRVTTIKPGFVDTRMTMGLPGMFLVASPERVARAAYRAIRRGRSVVYIPWFWRGIMWMVRAIPEFLFKRLSF